MRSTSGQRLVCASCLAAVERIGIESGFLDADGLAAAAAVTTEPEHTNEELYEQALTDEQLWDLRADGTLTEADPDGLVDGRAWTPGQRRTERRRAG